MFGRVSSLPLFWRVFGTNALVLTLAFARADLRAGHRLRAGGVRPSWSCSLVGLLVLLGLNLALLRPAFRPLDELAETMRRHDPLSPGERAQVDGGPDVAALAQTFNEMLDRLESERRESARQALVVQEGERRRIARELHDEVGQTLTGRDAAGRGPRRRASPRSCASSSTSCARPRAHGTEEVRRIARRLRPEALEDLGLQSALAGAGDRVRASRRDVRVDRRLEPRPAALRGAGARRSTASRRRR